MSANETAILERDFVPPDEDSIEGGSDKEAEYQKLLQRLCAASVVRRYEAYRDIAWDDPEMLVDPDDPRWELPEDHPLAATDWYKAQPSGVRSRIGLNMTAGFCYTGRIFEGVLSRGLLRFAAVQPHNSLEYRFAYHEVIEEAHHSLMFQEFVNRSGMPVPLVTADVMQFTDKVAQYGSTFPELLFICALGGEDPIDYVQREGWRKGTDRHPEQAHLSDPHSRGSQARLLCQGVSPAERAQAQRGEANRDESDGAQHLGDSVEPDDAATSAHHRDLRDSDGCDRRSVYEQPGTSRAGGCVSVENPRPV